MKGEAEGTSLTTYRLETDAEEESGLLGSHSRYEPTTEPLAPFLWSCGFQAYGVLRGS